MPYKDIDIPDGKDPEDYSYMERRAELFNFIIEAGHPDLLSRTEFARRYDVDKSTVSRDIKRIREEIVEELGADADLLIYAIFQKGLRDLARKEQWKDAMDYAADWLDFLFKRADSGIQKAADKHDISADVRKAAIHADAGFRVFVDTEGDADLDAIMADYDEGEHDFAAVPNSGDDEAVAIDIEDTEDDQVLPEAND